MRIRKLLSSFADKFGSPFQLAPLHLGVNTPRGDAAGRHQLHAPAGGERAVRPAGSGLVDDSRADSDVGPRAHGAAGRVWQMVGRHVIDTHCAPSFLDLHGIYTHS